MAARLRQVEMKVNEQAKQLQAKDKDHEGCHIISNIGFQIKIFTKDECNR